MNVPSGVTYLSIADVPGRQFFRCQTWRATLSVPTCAQRWRTAQTATGVKAEELERCMRCPIGALHAGEAHVERSTFYGSLICPRCRNGTTRRLIGAAGAARCISCFNREAEVKRGCNGRGTVPGLRLNARRIAVIVDHGDANQEQFEVAEKYTLDTVELALASLRVANGRIAFARARGRPAISVAELAKRTAVQPTEAEAQPQQNGTADARGAALDRLTPRRAVS